MSPNAALIICACGLEPPPYLNSNRSMESAMAL